MGIAEKVTWIVCATANSRHVYLAAFISDDETDLRLAIIRSSNAVPPRSLQAATWEFAFVGSMVETDVIVRKTSGHICAVDETGMFLIMSRASAPAYSRGLVYDPSEPLNATTWKKVDISGEALKYKSMTSLYAMPSSGDGRNSDGTGGGEVDGSEALSTFVMMYITSDGTIVFLLYDRKRRAFEPRTNITSKSTVFTYMDDFYKQKVILLDGELFQIWMSRAALETSIFQMRRHHLDARGLPAGNWTDLGQTSALQTCNNPSSNSVGSATNFMVNDVYAFQCTVAVDTVSNETIFTTYIHTFDGHSFTHADIGRDLGAYNWESLVTVPAPSGERPYWALIPKGHELNGVRLDGGKLGALMADNSIPLIVGGDPPADDERISGGAIAGIVVGVMTALLMATLAGIFVYRRRHKKRECVANELRNIARSSHSSTLAPELEPDDRSDYKVEGKIEMELQGKMDVEPSGLIEEDDATPPSPAAETRNLGYPYPPPVDYYQFLTSCDSEPRIQDTPPSKH